MEMNKQILVLSERARGYALSLCKGLNHFGHSVDLCVYDMELVQKKRSLPIRLWKKIADPNLNTEYSDLFNIAVNDRRKNIEAGKYQFIILIRGHNLNKENEALLKNSKIPIIHWSIDTISRAPMQLDVGLISDFRYVIDKTDMRLFGTNVEWLPLGYDNYACHPLNTVKDIDVFISGNIGKMYKKRREILEELGRSRVAGGYKCCFIGTTGSSICDRSVRIGNVEWIGKYVEADILARYQSRSKVCINIMQDDEGMPVNPSFFSIPACGSCLLNEKRDYLNEFLIPEEDYIAFEENEFLEKLEALLKDEKRLARLTESGKRKMVDKHSMKARAEIILSRYELLQEKTRR